MKPSIRRPRYTRAQINDLFQDGSIHLDTDGELLEDVLFTLCTERSDEAHPENFPRDLARTLFITHIKSARHIAKLSRQSIIYAFVAAIIGAAAGVVLTLLLHGKGC
jgi:hypothetical protein